MGNDKGNKEQERPLVQKVVTAAELQRVISNVVIERKLNKVHFLTNEPHPVKVIKFNLSGMTLEKNFTKACAGGVVDVAHATGGMPKAEFIEWKKSTGGVYEVFLSQASKRPVVITKESLKAELQSKIVAAMASGMTKEELEEAGVNIDAFLSE